MRGDGGSVFPALVLATSPSLLPAAHVHTTKGARASPLQPFTSGVSNDPRARRGALHLFARVLVADAEEFVHDVVAVLLREESARLFFQCDARPQHLVLRGTAAGHDHAGRFVVLLARPRCRGIPSEGDEPNRSGVVGA